MTQTEPTTDAAMAPSAFLDSDRHEGEDAADSVRAVMISRPRRELYDFWRDFANLPRFMENLRDVSDLGDGRSSWRVEGPAGSEVELVSEIREDVPGERIAWTSTEASDIDHEGWVAFRDNPFGRGTEVRLFIAYDPPGGAVGKVVAKVMQREPRIQARRELRRFKQLMETGEIPTSKAPDAAPRAARHF